MAVRLKRSYERIERMTVIYDVQNREHEEAICEFVKAGWRPVGHTFTNDSWPAGHPSYQGTVARFERDVPAIQFPMEFTEEMQE
jgi:hypothetical protein